MQDPSESATPYDTLRRKTVSRLDELDQLRSLRQKYEHVCKEDRARRADIETYKDHLACTKRSIGEHVEQEDHIKQEIKELESKLDAVQQEIVAAIRLRDDVETKIKKLLQQQQQEDNDPQRLEAEIQDKKLWLKKLQHEIIQIEKSMGLEVLDTNTANESPEAPAPTPTTLPPTEDTRRLHRKQNSRPGRKSMGYWHPTEEDVPIEPSNPSPPNQAIFSTPAQHTHSHADPAEYPNASQNHSSVPEHRQLFDDGSTSEEIVVHADLPRTSTAPSTPPKPCVRCRKNGIKCHGRSGNFTAACIHCTAASKSCSFVYLKSSSSHSRRPPSQADNDKLMDLIHGQGLSFEEVYRRRIFGDVKPGSLRNRLRARAKRDARDAARCGS